MNAIDLFCGCGGASLGLKMAGYKIVGAVDNNPVACETYRKNLGTQPICTDLRSFTGREILDYYDLKKSDIDLVVGCPPCQGFSSLRRTRYSEGTDERKSLVNVFLKRIKELEPKAVIFENVSGIATKEGRQYYLKRFIHRMEGLGYRSNWDLINAADYGIPQFRKRVFGFFAKTNKLICLPERTHSNPEKCSTDEDWKTVKDAIFTLPALLAGERDPVIPNHIARVHTERIMNLINNIPKNGGSRRSLPIDLWLPCHRKLRDRKSRGAESIYGRMTWRKPAPTITCRCTTPSSGRFLHPEQDRAITPREAARLQTFPDTFIFPEEFHCTERMIGNAVPVELMRIHGKFFRESL